MFIRKCACHAAATLILTIGAAATAAATDSGFYVGMNYGQSMFDVEDEEMGIFDITTSSSTDDKDTAWSLSAGYRFNPYIGLELGYLDLGETKIVETGRDIFPALTGRVEGTVGAKGPTMALVATIPANKFEFFGRLGFMSAKTELEARVTLTQGSLTASGSDGTSAKTTEVLAGLGMGYSFSDHFYGKVEWINIPKVGDEEETGEGDVGILSVGLQYRF